MYRYPVPSKKEVRAFERKRMIKEGLIILGQSIVLCAAFFGPGLYYLYQIQP